MGIGRDGDGFGFVVGLGWVWGGSRWGEDGTGEDGAGMGYGGVC